MVKRNFGKVAVISSRGSFSMGLSTLNAPPHTHHINHNVLESEFVGAQITAKGYETNWTVSRLHSTSVSRDF